VPVGRVVVAQDPLERLAYAMVGPLEAGVELGELSVRDFTRQPETEPQYSVPEGLGALVARWGAKVPVKLGTRVVRIDSTGPQVLVVTTDGQLSARARRRDGADRRARHRPVRLRPAAQRRTTRGDRPAADGALQQVASSFGRKVIDAPAGRGVLGLTRKDQVFDAIVRPYNRHAAIVFVGGDQARQLEEEGTGAALGFAVSALAEIYGNDLRGLLARSSVRRWGKDPFARGSWSMATPGNADKRLVLAQPPMPRACARRAMRWRCWARSSHGLLARCIGSDTPVELE